MRCRVQKLQGRTSATTFIVYGNLESLTRPERCCAYKSSWMLVTIDEKEKHYYHSLLIVKV